MNSIYTPSWIAEAYKHNGLAEIPGKEHNATIVKWLIQLNAWWKDDEVPWCGTFVAHCVRTAGVALPSAWYRAKAWANWGNALSVPIYGCVVVFERKGGGHVGFVVGEDRRGRLLVLGGNQDNKVSVSPFLRDRVVAYRWPDGVSFVPTALPVLDVTAASSRNEA